MAYLWVILCSNRLEGYAHLIYVNSPNDTPDDELLVSAVFSDVDVGVADHDESADLDYHESRSSKKGEMVED